MAVGGLTSTRESSAQAAAPPADLVAFCRREHPRLVGAVGLYTGQRELAEELAQETLLRVCRSWHEVRLMDSPGGWAHTVAINLAKSSIRRGKVGQRLAERLATDGESAGTEPDIGLIVRTAVAALPEPMREVVVLRFYLDLPVAEVARILGRPDGTVKALTSRAIKRLRAEGLAGLFEEPHAD